MSEHVITEITPTGLGLITLNRPQALNALSLDMVQALLQTLRSWQDDDAVLAVVLRGSSKQGDFGAFCAGGDIRFFHRAALAGDRDLDVFFTDEYTLNHLIQTYRKPLIAFIDGIIMGGGMGLVQGPTVLGGESTTGGGMLRVATERTRMAMPETRIGLFPDVGGGYFLSRLDGHLGEYLGLTGYVLRGSQAVAANLADGCIAAERQAEIWQHLAATDWDNGLDAAHWVASQLDATPPVEIPARAEIDRVFGLSTVADIEAALQATDSDWGRDTLKALGEQSPLMLHVTLEQIRRARGMTLAEELRMERDLVHHCFYLRPVAQSETVEGVRALAIDKDQQPKWQPARIQDVDAAEVAAFFVSPWPAAEHPLASLS